VAIASVVVGIANLGEDALGIGAAGTAYALGTAALVLGLAVTTAVLLWRPPRWPAVVTLLTLVGLVQLENGGGLLLLAGWLYAASASRRPTPAFAGPSATTNAADTPYSRHVEPIPL
jgi:hypothetical protein